MKDTSDDGDNSHAQALCATVTEHKQYMSNIQVGEIPLFNPHIYCSSLLAYSSSFILVVQLLINQVRECMPVMEASISTMRKQLKQTRISVAISSPLSESLPASRVF
jgi:hypothetical protein